MDIKTIDKRFNLDGQTVLLRLDLNVPIKDGQIIDDFKIKAVKPTVNQLLNAGGRVIIISHLGSPIVDGHLVAGAQDNLSLKPVISYLAETMGRPIEFFPDQDFSQIKAKLNKSTSSLIALDNLRFWPGELTDSTDLAQELANLADIFVNDAFAVSHRQQASVSQITNFLPSFAGPLLEKEIINLSRVFEKTQHPLTVVMGGAKIGSKVGLINNLGELATNILIGGGLANNFLAAQGYNIGQSLVDPESIKLAKQLIDQFGDRIVLPEDVIVADSDNQSVLRLIDQVGNQEKILDIGTATIQKFSQQIRLAKTLVWNGPMGRFEEEPYRHGTLFIAREVALRSRGRSYGVVGGGETVAALKMTKMSGYVDWVSTGGGAMLAFLGDQPMPGLKNII